MFATIQWILATHHKNDESSQYDVVATYLICAKSLLEGNITKIKDRVEKVRNTIKINLLLLRYGKFLLLIVFKEQVA